MLVAADPCSACAVLCLSSQLCLHWNSLMSEGCCHGWGVLPAVSCAVVGCIQSCWSSLLTMGTKKVLCREGTALTSVISLPQSRKHLCSNQRAAFQKAVLRWMAEPKGEVSIPAGPSACVPTALQQSAALQGLRWFSFCIKDPDNFRGMKRRGICTSAPHLHPFMAGIQTLLPELSSKNTVNHSEDEVMHGHGFLLQIC